MINKKTALILGLPAAFVMISGIILSLLIYFLMSTLEEGFVKRNTDIQLDDRSHSRYQSGGRDNSGHKEWKRAIEILNQSYDLPYPAFSRDSESDNNAYLFITKYPFWILGFLYVIPGLFGLLSALFQKKGLYIVSIIFSVISLLLMAAMAAVGFLFVFAVLFVLGTVSSQCHDENGVCKCGGETYNQFKSCSTISSVFSLLMSITGFIVIGWIAVLVMLIICSYFTCCAKTISTGGIVLSPAQQPMIPLEADPNAATYTQQSYNYPPPQQYYDQSIPSKV
ncbi:hypothetical protein BgiMline_015074 [Biomphalaria glabrata]|nr:hypothetical protein BgiMline_022186 [Biomphalaria glabrata]KAI8752900.1 hypothetical protein BgiBS90_031973 [Biomphalaria glabrata]